MHTISECTIRLVHTYIVTSMDKIPLGRQVGMNACMYPDTHAMCTSC